MFESGTGLLSDQLAKLNGVKVINAASTLKNFALELEGQRYLLLEAVDSPSGPSIKASMCDIGDLPKLVEAVCSVDWHWLNGAKICQIDMSFKRVIFSLDPQGQLAVSVSCWQGSPFLAFQPFKPQAK
jgi:hypothetical protein